MPTLFCLILIHKCVIHTHHSLTFISRIAIYLKTIKKTIIFFHPRQEEGGQKKACTYISIIQSTLWYSTLVLCIQWFQLVLFILSDIACVYQYSCLLRHLILQCMLIGSLKRLDKFMDEDDRGNQAAVHTQELP